jgi:hypothetical protein
MQRRNIIRIGSRWRTCEKRREQIVEQLESTASRCSRETEKVRKHDARRQRQLQTRAFHLAVERHCDAHKLAWNGGRAQRLDELRFARARRGSNHADVKAFEIARLHRRPHDVPDEWCLPCRRRVHRVAQVPLVKVRLVTARLGHRRLALANASVLRWLESQSFEFLPLTSLLSLWANFLSGVIVGRFFWCWLVSKKR